MSPAPTPSATSSPLPAASERPQRVSAAGFCRRPRAALRALAALACVVAPGGLSAAQQAKLVAPVPGQGDAFGISVALAGETAVVGVQFDDNPTDSEGSAHVFVRSGTVWTHQAMFTAADAEENDNLGQSVSLHADTAVAGAIGDDDLGDLAGSAYVFFRSGSVWTEQAKLLASDGTLGDEFGYSVSVDVDTVVAGAIFDDSPGTDAGSAYVFTRSGTTWTEEAELMAGDADASDSFGFAVSVSGDTALVGAVFDDAPAVNSGSAYVFVRSGSLWTEQAKLTAGDGAAFDGFGFSVALDGDTAVVGANADDDDGSTSGSAYVFVRSGTVWTQQAKLTAADAAPGDGFGESVGIDGDTAVIGARYDDAPGAESGSAYVFSRSGTVWTELSKLTASDGATGDQFGTSSAVSGTTVAVGAFAHDLGDDADAGAAYVFDLAAPLPEIPATSRLGLAVSVLLALVAGIFALLRRG